MTDIDMLSMVISKSGLKIGYIAERLGLTREGLYRKLRGQTEFKVSELAILQRVLRLSDADIKAIFFASDREANSRSEVTRDAL